MIETTETYPPVRMKILLVEDNTVEALYFTGVLKKIGYEVLGAANSADEALEIARSGHPDIVLMDIMLKGKMDGVEAASRIAAMCDIPIIYITALSDETSIHRAKATGPYGYLVKPITENDLFSTIEMALYKHHTSKALRDNEERFRTLVSNLPGAIFRCKNDAVWTMKYISDTIEKISGYPPIDFIDNRARSYAGIIYPGDSGMVNETVARGIANKKPYEIEYRIVHSDGTIRWVYEKGQGVFDEKGVLKWIDGGIFDISTRKSAEEDLTRAHNEIRYLLGSIMSVVIGVTLGDRITHWNPIAESTFNLPAAGILNRRFSECGIQWEWDKLFEGISTCIIEDRPVHLRDVVFINRKSEERILGMTINPVKDESGDLYGFIIYGADVTERRVLEKQLSQAQKMETIGQLAAGIAHEINSPMQYINSNIYYIKEEYKSFLTFFDRLGQCRDRMIRYITSEKMRQELDQLIDTGDIQSRMNEILHALDDSLEGVGRITRIIKSIKELAHPESVEMVASDLNKIIENSITVSRNEWKYFAELSTSYDPALDSIQCIPGELGQVILNLIINAAQAIEEKKKDAPGHPGTIIITTRRMNGYAEIRIKDTGGGIPENIQSKIFDPFFTTKEVGKGTGQGLAIAYNIIVKKHGGQISFETEAGKGTTFIIRLPVGLSRISVSNT